MKVRYWHWLCAEGVLLRSSTELAPEDDQVGDEHMCGVLQYSLYGTRDAAQSWEEELPSTLSDLKLTRGIACPCVWQGCINVKHIVATLHGDDITIGGERSVVEFLIRMTSRKHETKKQAIGEDVRHHNRGGSETHVREILKDLELERANHSATPCPVERENEGQHKMC